jgi:hypothetical protein
MAAQEVECVVGPPRQARRDAQQDIVAAQQQRLVLMKHRGLVGDQVFLRLQRELDHVALSVE